MPIINFPPLDIADEHGLLAIGGDLEPESIILAYSRGIFPWPIAHDYPMTWFSPDPRGVLQYQDLRIPKRLKREMKNKNYQFVFNKDFRAVIEACSLVPRPGQNETWITEEIKAAYYELFKRGIAYCVECYDEDELIGGVYGVCLGELISGESMFFKKSNVSKMCLIFLMEHLNSKGIHWIDTQMVTPVVESLGGKEIPRVEYVKRIKQLNLKKPRQDFFPA